MKIQKTTPQQQTKKQAAAVENVAKKAMKSGYIPMKEESEPSYGNVKFTNGALGFMKQDSFVYNNDGVGERTTTYDADLKDLTTHVYYFQGQNQNGAKIDKFRDKEYDFINFEGNIELRAESKVDCLNLFGCDASVFAQNGKKDEINIYNSEDHKSFVFVDMDEGDVLYDAPNGVRVQAEGNVTYHQMAGSPKLETKLGVAGRTKVETLGKDGEVKSTKYYALDGTELKEDYALSKQRKTSDGYVINKFPNGKTSILTPEGEALPAGTKIIILKNIVGEETVQILKDE
jgi:hypothetical protein